MSARISYILLGALLLVYSVVAVLVPTTNDRFVQSTRQSLSNVPSIESLSIPWRSQPLRAMPLISNFYGAANLHADMMNVGPITTAPFVGNLLNSILTINNKTMVSESTEWKICEGIRENDVMINSIRLPFEGYGLMQQWRFKNSGDGYNVSFVIQGPLFRECGNKKIDNNQVSNPCGWGLALPVDPSQYSLSVVIHPSSQRQMMIAKDKQSNTVTASYLWMSTNSSTPITLSLNSLTHEFIVKVTVPNPSMAGLDMVSAVSGSEDAAVEKLHSMITSYSSLWNHSCEFYEQRWRNAFDDSKNGANKNDNKNDINTYSGVLPIFKSNDPSLNRLYYWSTLAMVQLQRTNLLSAPRGYVVSDGASNSYQGDFDMGGTGQFIWDLSFNVLSMTLLDPRPTKNLIVFLIQNSNLTSSPISIPQNWDAYNNTNVSVGGYCFDYLTTFLFIQQYISITNDVSFLQLPIENIYANERIIITPYEYLLKLAWTWTSYPSSAKSQFLRDYGSDKRSFLEAVPTYTNVIPALQFGNAAMLLSMAELSSMLYKSNIRQVNTVEITESMIHSLTTNATSIINDVITYQYVNSTGYYQVLYQNSTNATSVRAISDFIYTGSLTILSHIQIQNYLPLYLRLEMIQYFKSELLGNGWVRALSLLDPVMANVMSLSPSLEDKVAMRSDWTGTGGYGGLTGTAIDTLVDLEQGFISALYTLRNVTLAATQSMPGQGIVVTTPPYIAMLLNDTVPINGPYVGNFPEFFDLPNFPTSWPSTERSVQTSVASIMDSFIRSIFGWRPKIQVVADSLTPTMVDDLISASIYLPTVGRGSTTDPFEATLYGLQTPFHNVKIDISVSYMGVQWKRSNNSL